LEKIKPLFFLTITNNLFRENACKTYMKRNFGYAKANIATNNSGSDPDRVKKETPARGRGLDKYLVLISCLLCRQLCWLVW
jgi:hypothetical protein